MKIQELQEMSIKAIKDRCSRLGIERTEETMMIHFMEEFGELAKQIMNKKLKKKEIDLKNVAEELSDCFILLFNLADHFNVDLKKSLIEKIEDVNKK